MGGIGFMAKRIRDGLTSLALPAIWCVRLVTDVCRYGVVNRSPLMAASILAFLGLGMVIVAAKLSAPFIYTLF